MYETPIPVSIRSIDPGARSGVTRFTPPVADRDRWLVETYSCDVWGRDPTDEMRAYGTEALIIESPGINSRGAFLKMVLSLGQTIGVWRREWRLAGGAKSRELDVVQVSWRAGILGGNAGKLETDGWKKAAIDHVETTRDWPDSPWDLVHASPIDGEMAESLCMGWWALHSPALADLLGPRALASLGWDDKKMCLEAKASRGKTND